MAQVAATWTSAQTTYLCRRQHLIDTGQLPGNDSSQMLN
jgi:hypothetical protein